MKMRIIRNENGSQSCLAGFKPQRWKTEARCDFRSQNYPPMNLDTSDLRLKNAPKALSRAFLRKIQRAADRKMKELRRAGKIRKPVSASPSSV